MFESLDETIKHDTAEGSTKTERFLRWALAVVVAVLVLGGLYMGVRLLE